MDTRILRGRRNVRNAALFAFLLIVETLVAGTLSATTVVPISDRELSNRADVIVHGIVVSSRTVEDGFGRPETVTVVRPLRVVKGELSGTLVLRQAGGRLPDGRFLQLWGRPEYQVGHEVVVFAIARPEGDYQTAELLLGKFEVEIDEQAVTFAVPALAAPAPAGVTVLRPRSRKNADRDDAAVEAADPGSPRELSGFLASLTPSGGPGPSAAISPAGRLSAVVHPEYVSDIHPLWDNIGSLWRYNNGASAVWTLDGTANVTGGGVAEATAATATWDDEPNSTIGYTIGTGSSNFIHLDALSSPCGWSTCMNSGGVIGCGGPDGVGGTHSWRGEGYSTISGGEVWLRSYCTMNFWDSVTTQSVLTHELGHTLGLGHSDQGATAHDVCRGDEDLATMRSFVQHRTTLGTDDSDAVRWLYGDGGNSCNGGGPLLTVTKTGSGTGTVTSAPAGISCGTTCSFTFAEGTVVNLSPAPGTNSVFSGWSGDADCSDGAVTMSAARNCTATFDLTPDLVVSALAVPAAATAGSAIAVSETTKNQGGAGGASTTRYYVSTNTTWDTADTPIGSRAVGTLAAGASSSATINLTVPANTAPGNYFVIARADADGQLVESNETNNTRSGSIHIGPPDLVVSALSAPASGGAGQTIAVTDTTHNQSGTGPAAASITRFYLSANSTWDTGDVALGFRNVPALQPNDSSAGSTSFAIPAGTAPGSYFIIAKADADSLVAETLETNNTRANTIVIGPDLTVSALSAPATGGAGMAITVTDTTKNAAGGGSTGIATTTAFYLSANTTIGAGDVLLGSRTVPLLAPGASSADSTTLTIPAATAPGSYYIIASADDGAAVPETVETNNSRTVLVKVSPDLLVSALTAPTTAAAGAVLSVTDTTKNQGQGTAAATTTRFYLSANTAFDAAADVEIGNRAVALLLTGTSSPGTSSVTIPPGTAAGTWYILARADADGAVSESNEGNNNLASKAITITP